jgi:Fe2+ transport system protein FeoA
MNLHHLKLNQKAKVKSINLENHIKERLHSMGLIEGITITLKTKVPFNGPKVYEIMNTYIAIRDAIAKKIEIEE